MKASILNVSTIAARNNQASVPAPTGEETPEVFASEFQRNVFNCAFDTGAQLNVVVQSARARMLELVRAQYGDVSPTYAQFKDDRAIFKTLAAERCLVDDQVIRKPYCAAIVELFGALPVSDSPAAVAKRLQRPVAAPKAVKVDTPPAQRVESESSTIGQFIAKYGAAAVLVELAKILGTEKATMLDAKTLVAVASHLKAA